MTYLTSILPPSHQFMMFSLYLHRCQEALSIMVAVDYFP